MSESKDIDPRILEIAQKLKVLRIKKGYRSYEHFAHDHNLQRMAYWRLEKGSNLTLKTLFKILDIHGVSLEELSSLSLKEEEINI
jgi:transcriptional regulator with XRE-family HTH domain